MVSATPRQRRQLVALREKTSKAPIPHTMSVSGNGSLIPKNADLSCIAIPSSARKTSEAYRWRKLVPVLLVDQGHHPPRALDRDRQDPPLNMNERPSPPPCHGDQEIFVRTGARSLSGILVLVNPQPILNDPEGFPQRRAD